MFSKDETRNIISFAYYVVMFVVGLIITAIGFGAPEYSASSTIMLGFALMALGLNIFRYWLALDQTKLKMFLSIISYAALIIAMFFGIGIAISNPTKLTSRAIWFGSLYLVACTLIMYPLFSFRANDATTDSEFELANWGVLLAPIVFFIIGIIINLIIPSIAILLGVSISIFLILSHFTGNPVNTLILGIFTVLYSLFGGFDEEFLNGEYYALVPLITLIILITCTALDEKYTRNIKDITNLIKYSYISSAILLLAGFIVQHVIISKWWLGILILIGLLFVDGIIFYEISYSIGRKQRVQNSSSSQTSSSSVDSKTESLVREKLRRYVKTGNYNVARLTQYHITVSCTSLDHFITYNGDVEIKAEMKFLETSIGVLGTTSNQQMLIDAKNNIESELYKNAKKALEVAVSQGAKLSGKYSIEVDYEV